MIEAEFEACFELVTQVELKVIEKYVKYRVIPVKFLLYFSIHINTKIKTIVVVAVVFADLFLEM